MAISGKLLKSIMVNEFETKNRSSGPFLYHVNTVQTAALFLKNKGLLSRGAVEDLGLKQTPQKTDADDKSYGIYYDIFFDSCDIHYQCRNYCSYGPVSFRYSIDLLEELDDEKKIIEVTKSNPISWKNSDKQEYYFNETNIRDSANGFKLDNFQQHITVVDMHTPLPFSCLLGIRLDEPDDDPRHQELFIKAKDYLENLIEKLSVFDGIYIPFSIRNGCKPNCHCKESYRNMADDQFEKLFSFDE
ncbi:hypothetical protein [uncultured Succiniclasticum sp.]|jgi:hypothetical protein|uniref:hypothetical protein n=1 Tax=uncultured Succiniclasticum sp. TaxID=1500547 RepID=UPI0025F74554|nr:hypothetical protein [uncultured Succiniclasticum sp.]